MASRRVTRSAGGKVPKNTTSSQSHRIGKAVGGALIVFACLWLGSLLLFRLGVIGGAAGLSLLPLPAHAPTVPPTATVSPLTAAGISLEHPTQAPALTQQQALLIASQLESDAATQATKTSAQYVLLTYAGTHTSTAHAGFSNVAAWMIIYQQIPLAPGDPSADPTPFPQTHHDLYVFLDANSGTELLAIWV
jgi:hypothetical protein